jgi:hypothetical protein
MSLRYSGPNADYPVYCCRSDRDMAAGPLCQEVRALPVDGLIEQNLLEAFAADQIAMAMAALGQIAIEAARLERQWVLRRERARYDAERARRQYDAVEPENRLVARTLELLWEEKLRAAESIETDYEQWRLEVPLVLSDADRATLLAMGENLPGIWRVPTTTAADRKRILRFVIREVTLDQKRVRGQVSINILWQTGAVTEHAMRRRVHRYDDYDNVENLRRRVSELNRSGKMDREIAAALNYEGFVGARGCPFQSKTIWILRQRWGLNTVKINGIDANPARWPDGTYSIQGAAAALGATPQTIFKYLKRRLLNGRQSTKGQPWQIDLTDDQILQLRACLQRMRPSTMRAS